MAYFYVSSVIGTRTTGGGTTKQTGTFSALGAANVYASVSLAIADGASDADIICVSDLHNHIEASDHITLGGGATTALTIISVSDTACDSYSVGGKESTSGAGFDIKFTNLSRAIGLSFISKDYFVPDLSGTICIFDYCTFKLTDASNLMYFGDDGLNAEFNECILDLNNSTSSLQILAGSTVAINGGSIAATTSGTISNLTTAGFISGGGGLYITETDLSVVNSYLINAVGGNLTVDDCIDIRIDKCTLHASVNFHSETFTSKHHKLLITQSSSSSATAEYQYYFHTRGGTVQNQDDAGIHRDESTAFADSGKKVSLNCTTDSNAELAMPFEFEFPTRFTALATASTDTLRIYLAVVNTTTLYDDDVYATLTYPDGTTKNVFNSVNSLGTPSDLPVNIFRTEAVLTTDSGSTWKNGVSDLTGYNEYYIDLDTSADVGADCVPKITMHIAIPSITIYFDTTVDVVA